MLARTTTIGTGIAFIWLAGLAAAGEWVPLENGVPAVFKGYERETGYFTFEVPEGATEAGVAFISAAGETHFSALNQVYIYMPDVPEFHAIGGYLWQDGLLEATVPYGGFCYRSLADGQLLPGLYRMTVVYDGFGGDIHFIASHTTGPRAASPEPPTNFRVSRQDDLSFTLEWDAPAEGHPIRYTLLLPTYCRDFENNRITQRSLPPAATSINFTCVPGISGWSWGIPFPYGLTTIYEGFFSLPDHLREYGLKAHYLDGTSSETVYLDFVSPETGLPVTGVTDSSVSFGVSGLLEWVDFRGYPFPYSTPIPYCRYAMQYKLASSRVWKNCAQQPLADDPFLACGGLAAGTTYDFRLVLQPESWQRDGLATIIPATATTSGAETPPPPVNLGSSPASDASLALQWDAPAGEVTSYQVQYRLNGDLLWLDAKLPSPKATSLGIDGLGLHEWYHIRVRSLRQATASPWVKCCSRISALPLKRGLPAVTCRSGGVNSEYVS